MNLRAPAIAMAILSMAFSCDTIKPATSVAGSGASNALAAPTNLTGQAQPGGTAIDLTWTNNAVGDSAYEVDMNTVPFGTGGTVQKQTIAPDSTSFTWTGLMAGSTYYFEVFAISGTQLSPPSNVAIVGTDVPGTPSNLVAAPVSLTEIDLSWTTPGSAGVTGYRIERSTDMGSTWSTLASVGASPTSYQDLGLSQTVEYCYRVFATNLDGDSFPSPMACATPMNVTLVAYSGSTDYGSYPTIAVTSGGLEHIAHTDTANLKLLYTHGVPGGPYTTLMPDTSTNQTGMQGKGFDLDYTGASNFSYFAQSPTAPANGRLNYTLYPGTPATVDGPATNEILGQDSKLRAAPGGTVHIISYDELFTGATGYNALRHVMRVGGLWSITQVTSSSELVITNISNFLDLDSSGNPSFIYSHRLNAGLPTQHDEIVWARYLSGSWTTTVVPNQSQPYSNPSFAFDGSGNAHVIYLASTGLGHATNASGSWTFELITPPLVGVNEECTGIAIDKSSGRIHVVWGTSGLQSGLQYARKDPGGLWVLRTLDLKGNVGHYPSIAVDSNGMIHIAHYDATAKKLKITSGTP